jgi:glycosyltransferase involved in cell wall biosynthesis
VLDGRLPPAAPARPPLVSVAVSTWNRADLVGRAVRSVLAQTFGDFELLVVDDGSTDATPDVICRIEDSRLRYIRHDQNRGISCTRNTAITRARGEWMAFLDDDNEWAADYLERQLALAASRPGADVVYCRARRHDDRTGRDIAWTQGVREGRVFRNVVDGWHLLMSCVMIRRALLVEIGGLDERLGTTEDVDLWLRLGRRAEFAGTADELVVRHDHHGGRQLSLDFALRARDLAVLDDKWRAEITAACGPAAYRWWRLGLELCGALLAAEAGQRAEALKSARRMARSLPWSAPHVAGALSAAVFGRRVYARLAGAGRALGRLTGGRIRA